MTLLNLYESNVLLEDLKPGIYNIPSDIPDAALFDMTKWKTIKQSPYSNSYYDTNTKSWNYTEDKSYRISDHWNFTSNGEIHCETIGTLKSGFSLGQYDRKIGKYKIIKNYGLDGNGFASKFNIINFKKKYLQKILLTLEVEDEKIFKMYLFDLSELIRIYRNFLLFYYKDEYAILRKLLNKINNLVKQNKLTILNQSRSEFYNDVKTKHKFNYNQEQELKFAIQNRKIPFEIIRQIADPNLSANQMRDIRYKYT
jgi:hypothetical protein